MRVACGKLRIAIAAMAMVVGTAAQADEVKVMLHQLAPEDPGQAVGEVRFRDHEYGLLVVPHLKGLGPGPHAAHIHENPDCGPATHGGKTISGGAAGGHFDPQGTGRHEGPYGDGHLGDLPVLIVEADGTATMPVLAPRLKVADIHNRSLMIHAGADRYERHGTHAHGKGGMRMYCGVIP